MTQTTDAALVERLRDLAKSVGQTVQRPIVTQAADTIEAQARRIEALMEGLERAMIWMDGEPEGFKDDMEVLFEPVILPEKDPTP